MNTTADLIRRAAQSPDPIAAIDEVRRHVSGLKRLDLTEPEAVAILGDSATLALKAGMVTEATRLEEARDALQDGAIIPTSWYFGWLPAAPVKPGMPTPIAEAAKATQPTGPQEVVVVSMPPRVTRTIVTRDKRGQIVETTQVSEDVA